MAELKTKITTAKVSDFINAVPDEKKKADGFTLLKIFQDSTGHDAKMWGASIIGFDQYHYKSERSSQEGDWPMVGFSPRKANLSLYILTDFPGMNEMLEKLGKYKRGSGCLYLNKLADVDMDILKDMIKKSYQHMKKLHA